MKGGLEGCEKGVADWEPRLTRNNTRLSRVSFVPFSVRIPQQLSEGGDRKEWWWASVREVYRVPPTVYARHIRHIRCIAFIPSNEFITVNVDSEKASWAKYIEQPSAPFFPPFRVIWPTFASRWRFLHFPPVRLCTDARCSCCNKDAFARLSWNARLLGSLLWAEGVFSRCSTEIGVVWRGGVLRNRREFANEELNETAREGRGVGVDALSAAMFILSSTVSESRNTYEMKSGESKLTRNFSFLNYIYNSFEFFSNMVMEILFRSLIIINANRKGNELLTS